MMSAMYGGIGNQAFGPPEAFFPFTNIDPNGNVMQDSLESYDEDDDSEEEKEMLKLADLIDFGDESEEDDKEAAIAEPWSTPARPNTAASEDQTHRLLDSRLVGAFRKNQDEHQLLSRNIVSQASLAFGGQGPIRGLKNSRLAAANTPITPVRRKKPAKAALPSSPASPLVKHSNKRKASNGEEMSHKRSRSMI